MIAHIWTFKDDVLLFNVKNNIEMYTIGQNEMKLDGVITEFCDVYAPIAQILRKQAQENGLLYATNEDKIDKNNLRKPKPIVTF